MKRAKELNTEWPSCLDNINWYLRTREDAKEISAALRLFFSEDGSLMDFADWLDLTAKYCSTYDLSY